MLWFIVMLLISCVRLLFGCHVVCRLLLDFGRLRYWLFVVCLSVCLSVCPTVCFFVCLFVCCFVLFVVSFVTGFRHLKHMVVVGEYHP